ncbi:BON domain-containing protein [Rhizobium rhizogenes]|uniref:BON domain-containing protein n=1 Tax=Rhizobium TaxID=379 RepID=UPI00026ECC58|nr:MULTISPECIES: BON domain-containing protein [Rhizobium]OCJ24980.1 pilus assembly protein [Agrobacterium sp. B131/95]EJK80477.1 putative phospholipid-binding protein [Rhizobium sp. AP16]KEA07633.1 pilus assembly protein [Rhizobium rhizogenes]MDJ1632987.1 BON domain-containing protein [Rhizobium rhizogenes]MQB28951.1 BON domain-containing protein [Rhizobium rhizogenes]
MTPSFSAKVPRPNAPETIDLEFAVENALAIAEDIDGPDVFVTADGPKIVLSGWLATEEEIDRAGKIAATICGIARVDNQIVRG